MSSVYIKEINKTLRKNVVCCSISVVIYGFFQGTFSNLKKKYFPCQSLLISKTYICLYDKKNLHTIAIVPLTGRGGGGG